MVPTHPISGHVPHVWTSSSSFQYDIAALTLTSQTANIHYHVIPVFDLFLANKEGRLAGRSYYVLNTFLSSQRLLSVNFSSGIVFFPLCCKFLVLQLQKSSQTSISAIIVKGYDSYHPISQIIQALHCFTCQERTDIVWHPVRRQLSLLSHFHPGSFSLEVSVTQNFSLSSCHQWYAVLGQSYWEKYWKMSKAAAWLCDAYYQGGGEGALTHIHSPVAKIQKNDITKFSKLYWPNFTSGCWDIVTRGDDSLSSVDFCCGFVWSRCADTLRNI